ncbi:MAG: methyltransferase, partial [Burkholderiales bacterium]
MLDRFLQILAEEGFLARIEAGWVVIKSLLAGDPVKATSHLLKEHPSSRARITLVANCGADLAPILQGKLNPLERLFPNGSADLAEQLYRDAPEARAFNQLVRETVREISASLPTSRQMRVLEVGGGTGGTTAWVAPILGENASYLFTDIGSSMVARARKAFAAHAFMDFKVFDLERDSAEQGIMGGYDIILASNVIHATADLASTLTRLRDLLAPGGIILMLEVAGDERWIDVTFALTDGWWRFTDLDVRQASPLLSRRSWTTLLDKLGFESQILNPPDRRTREALITARKPASVTAPASGVWAIVPDALGVAEAVAAKLKAAGCSVHAISEIDADTQLPENLAGVIHLRALDLPRLNDTAPGNPALTQQTSLGSLLELVKAIGRTSFTGAMPRLWVTSRGAQPVDDLLSVDPAQATVWGMTKSIALE